MKLKTAAMIFAAAISVFSFTACGRKNSSNQKVIGISIPSADHGWTGGVVYWAEQAKEDLELANPDVKVIVVSSATSAEQVDKIENLMVQGIDALVVLPNEPQPLTKICSNVAEKGIKLIVVDRNLTRDVQDLAVTGDNKGFGRNAAEVIVKELNGKGNIVIMEGAPCQVNTDRCNAFLEVMQKYPEIKILESQTSKWNPEEGYKLMETYLQKHEQIDAVWTGDDDVQVGALKAYEASGRKDVKLFVGGGGSKTMIKHICDKHPLVRQTVLYPPKMIYNAAEEALAILNGKAIENKHMIIPADVVDQSNAKDFYFPDSKY